MKKNKKNHKKLEIVGHCPECGAPIWAELPADGVPMNRFSCACRIKNSSSVTILPYVTPSVPYNPNVTPWYPNTSNTWCTQSQTVKNIPQFSVVQ